MATAATTSTTATAAPLTLLTCVVSSSTGGQRSSSGAFLRFVAGSRRKSMFVHHRMAPGESLFDRTPPGTTEEVRKPFCLCPKGFHTEHPAGRGTGNAHSHCVAYENVDYTSVFPSLDTTAGYTRSPAGAESVLEVAAFSAPLGRNVWSADSRKDLLGDGPRRRASAGFQPVFAQAQLDQFAYFFPEDHLAEARPEVQPEWPAPSGLTWSRALERCQLALANSTVGAVCGWLLGRRLDEAVDLCVLDLQLKDDLGWEDALLPHLENECESRLLEKVLEGPEPAGAAAEVATALRCPNHCHGNGECTEWGCQCYSSHSFHDCSLAVGEYPDACSDANATQTPPSALSPQPSRWS